MRVNIDQLSNDAHIWIFGISPALDAPQSATVLRQVDAFLDEWAAHGVPITGASEVREGSFLIIAADENREKSGCSIDRMFGTLKALERELNVKILDANRVFLRDHGSVRAVARGEFRNAASPETPVFDVTAEKLGEVRTGAWERRAADSWHRQLL
ncbi:MAG TPA: hypothetical protein VGQ36_06040 [Thermoanaerobaculia bacterium]|jgi:hypothetical protein|nr:hypothetical protein [Thermoanaerobaculia bacterium]